jgi:hypothetical protein
LICYRCNLVFEKTNIAALHQSISDHRPLKLSEQR